MKNERPCWICRRTWEEVSKEVGNIEHHNHKIKGNSTDYFKEDTDKPTDFWICDPCESIITDLISFYFKELENFELVPVGK